MTYTYSFKPKFAGEFANFPVSQQDKVLDFLDKYNAYGLSDFSIYEGKISASWSGDANPANYEYAKKYDLWHYHIGIPSYSTVHSKYKTSDWVLHFQWVNKGSHIDIVDLYSHYRSDGTFHLPSLEYLQA